MSAFKRLITSPNPLVILALLGTAACGGDDGDDGGIEPITLRGSCDDVDHVGSFQVAAEPMFSSVSGQVTDAVLPVTVREEVTRSGDCALLRRLNPFCDPACTGEQVCNHDGICDPRPVPQDVGSVTLTGLEESIEMMPNPPGNNYFATPQTNPIFSPGAEVRLRASGGAIALGGFGFETLTIAAVEWTIMPGKDLAISWTAPAAADAKTRLHFEVAIDQHGTSPVALECDFPDTGSALVAASVIDALLAEGVSGFPNGRAIRRTVDRVELADGCVDLAVASPIANAVRVEGHTPCMRDQDCPPPQTCDIPNQTCVD